MPDTSLANISSIAFVPTTNGSRYLQQLCKHWSHSLAVEFTSDTGTVTFPKNARGADYPAVATLSLNSKPGMLDLRIDASSTEQLEGLKGIVERHLDRFAFREAPLRFNWS